MDKTKVLEVLKKIAEDQKKDAETMTGKPFTGATVGEYFGKQGAAIAALAQIITLMLEDEVKPNG